LPLCLALLTEPGLDVGLTPADVKRQIECGAAHVRKQLGAAAGATGEDPEDAARGDAWESPQAVAGALDPALLEFPFGANVANEAGPYGPNGGRR
jgi:hypothetical protein